MMGHSESPFLNACLAHIEPSVRVLALDVPSGSGRHIGMLCARGIEVVAADLDMRLLKLVPNASPGVPRVALDASKELPFAPESFDLVISIHPIAIGFLATVPRLLRAGGHLVFETFGAQGKNAIDLPRPGEIAAAVAPLQPIRYVEKRTRSMPERVTVKALFRR